MVHVSGWISQRAIGAVPSAADAAAVIEAVAGGHLVLTTETAPRAGVALDRLLDRLPLEHREAARTLCEDTYLGAIGPVVTRAGRSCEVAPGRRRLS